MVDTRENNGLGDRAAPRASTAAGAVWFAECGNRRSQRARALVGNGYGGRRQRRQLMTRNADFIVALLLKR
jgi:hypothetical protein